eukprot:Protomagalhaensia_sp_Gyna_25__4705@NODE_452_length_3394_cov_64_037258_g347_i0_p1_GENE_NODE_452_length_3394_cov_64_037258_g347_i0NODE_452_length_3394_cov_64_037258_g347_i0_p1_ORF_typecomplete_len455_score36_25MBOAT/PF03062_19/12MBOAT/PF03062_19/6e36MBOAT_2/PF13813_6/2_7e03MBOAT_2/PF13813_6/6_8e03MBOAT_2/PF13813_6/0_00018_NODE_452_length_3394_cov_64_037258_g347_i0181382
MTSMSSAAVSLRHRTELLSPNSDVSTTDADTTTEAGSPPAEIKRPKCKQLLIHIIERRASPSILDICDSNSTINQSDFKGIVILLHVLCGLYLIANPIYKLYETGRPIESTLAKDMFSDFFLLMFAWAACFAWAFTSYVLFLGMKYRVLSFATTTCLQHSTQAILILGMMGLARERQWTVTPSFFILVVAVLHYMKMHSFVACTMDLLTGPPGNAVLVEEINLKNYFNYLFCPVLVYSISYPRSPHNFRVGYFVQKMVHLFGSLALIYTLSSQMIIPVFDVSLQRSPIHNWARLIVPLVFILFLFFYMTFECICNLLAELSGYGDRRTYEDWWNCTTWDDLARKWNKPVHEFLLCHVYISSYRITKQSKFLASLVTFLFSALLHEAVLTGCLRLVGGWMFSIMLAQLPLMALSHYHKHTTFGIYYVWFGLIAGIPTLAVLYGRQWANGVMWSSI